MRSMSYAGSMILRVKAQGLHPQTGMGHTRWYTIQLGLPSIAPDATPVPTSALAKLALLDPGLGTRLRRSKKRRHRRCAADQVSG